MRNFFNFYKLVLESAFPSDSKELERILKKARPRIDPNECSQQIEILLKLKDNRTKINAFEWLKKGTIILPEDLPKVEQALKIAKNKKLDPQKFKSPQELINKYSNISHGSKLINPETIPEFYDPDYRDNGVIVYTVEDSPEGQLAVRNVLNNNYGEDFSPWCLIYGNGHGGVSKEAKEYWEYYSSYPKKIAFQRGKVIAFSADSSPRKKRISPYIDEEAAKEAATNEFEEEIIEYELRFREPANWSLPKEYKNHSNENFYSKEQHIYEFIFEFLKFYKSKSDIIKDHLSEVLDYILNDIDDLNLKDKIEDILDADDPYEFFKNELSEKEKNDIHDAVEEEWDAILADHEKILRDRYKIKTFHKSDPKWGDYLFEYYRHYYSIEELPKFSYIAIIDESYNYVKDVFFFEDPDDKDEGIWWDLDDEKHPTLKEITDQFQF